MRKAETFEEIEDGSDGEDVVDVDVGDETGEREVVDFSEGCYASGCACDEVGNLKRKDVAEL